MMINVTMLASYLYCPRKFFLQQILKIREPLNDKMIKGKIRHEVFHVFNISEKKLLLNFEKSDSIQKIEQDYARKYSELFNEKIMKNMDLLNELKIDAVDFYNQGMFSFVNESRKRAVIVHSFLEKGFFGEELCKEIFPKIITELQITSQNLELKGVIDKIEVRNDFFVPVEIKTGTTPKENVWQTHKIQIAAYCLLLEDYFNKKTSKGFVHYLDSDSIRPVFVNPFLKAEVMEVKSKVSDLLESKGIPDYCRNELNCRKNHLKNLVLKDAPITESFK